MADVLDDAQIARVLSITAHPDDVDFGAAGTVARWTEAGIEVVYCVVTDGDAGGFDEGFPRAEMPALRGFINGLMVEIGLASGEVSPAEEMASPSTVTSTPSSAPSSPASEPPTGTA